MCISFPGQVVGIDAAGAVVETRGRRRRASTFLIDDVAVGDWVAVAAGTIVDRLEPHEAAELQHLLDRGNEPDQPASRIVPRVAVPTTDPDRPEGEPDVHPN
jgi:hydrogenase assembly chaperone HypC/HupF